MFACDFNRLIYELFFGNTRCHAEAENAVTLRFDSADFDLKLIWKIINILEHKVCLLRRHKNVLMKSYWDNFRYFRVIGESA